MSDLMKRWIELRRREQQTDGTWSCHYVIFEFGTRTWRLKKGCADGTFRTPEEAASAALAQAQQIIDSLQPAIPYLQKRNVRRNTPKVDNDTDHLGTCVQS